MAQGLLCQKVPLLFELFSTSRDGHPSGTYHMHHVFQDYAQRQGLERLVEPTDMSKHKISAVLMVSDIWQALIKIEPKSAVWLPIAIGTFIFPATLHKDRAYAEAQQLKETTLLTQPINLSSLTEGLQLLEDPRFFNCDVSALTISIPSSAYPMCSTMKVWWAPFSASTVICR
jgi:hypothetical protein